MKEGYNLNKNPFLPGDIFHVHISSEAAKAAGQEVCESQDTCYYPDATEAGKAITDGLASKDKKFVFQGVTYQILNDSKGYFDLLDEEDSHKHYRFGSEALNFFVKKIS